jgi:non-lysosomal glucosylceramidase
VNNLTQRRKGTKKDAHERLPELLFQIPDCASADAAEVGFPAGGFGAGHFTFTGAGEFRRWRLHPGLPERDEDVPADRFHVWARQGRHVTARTLSAVPIRQRRLFPFTWSAYHSPETPTPNALAGVKASERSFDPCSRPTPLLESLAFSPLLTGSLREASLPLYMVIWRVHNPTDAPMQAAIMLTWACGWPSLLPEAAFDFQHDRLCLTGALGDPRSYNRMGIALPDLHHEGIYLQGIEPWEAAGGGAEVREDFAEDGELDAAIARGAAQGAAAWVKFDLDARETKEIPFVIVWHFPLYESGPAARQERFYTRFLEKRRPDNAIAWLAEQAFQNFGAETANYRYWIQQIEDRQAGHLANPLLSPAEKARLFNGLAALLDADTVWTEEGRFRLLLREGQTWKGLRASLADALPVAELWPEIARQLTFEG